VATVSSQIFTVRHYNAEAGYHIHSKQHTASVTNISYTFN